MTLERELIDLFASSPNQRNRDILVGYYGWEDGQQRTLTEIGNRFGITRERVRQICAKLTKRPDDSPIAAPVMDRALALISERLPCPALQLETELAKQRLTAVGLSVESVATSARLLNRPIEFQVVNVQNNNAKRFVVPPELAPAVPAIVDLAKRNVFFHGLTTVAQIRRTIFAAKKLAKKPTAPTAKKRPDDALAELDLPHIPPKTAERLIRETVLLIDGFHWLDESTGWFQLDSIHRHGLPRAIDKVLAVAGAVTASQLSAALARNRRLWKTPPPENVLIEFCREMPDVRIDADRIISDPPRDWKKSLTGVESQLVALLKTHGPAMERGVMEDLCVEGGMNRFSFHAFVSWSPVIIQLGHSVYGLLGAKVSDKQVADLLVKRRAGRANHRVLNRHGRTDDGRVWLSYRLSKAASTYAVITIPAALRDVVSGRFQFLDPNGVEIGTLATKDGRAWGLGAFLRKHDAKIGDHIVLTLDLNKRTASVTWDEHAKSIED